MGLMSVYLGSHFVLATSLRVVERSVSRNAGLCPIHSSVEFILAHSHCAAAFAQQGSKSIRQLPQDCTFVLRLPETIEMLA